MKRSILHPLGAFLMLLASFSLFAADELMVTDPWMRAAPPNAPALALFMGLENHSSSDIILVEAKTTIPGARVELHRTVMADGMMKMAQQSEIKVASHQSVMLEPGSWHIMLIGPDHVPTAGEKVGVTLTLKSGVEQKFEAVVRKGKMMMNSGHGHHNH